MRSNMLEARDVERLSRGGNKHDYTEQIARHFDSLSDFENFRLRWIRSCTAINRKCRNAEYAEKMEKRAERLGL